MLMFFAGAGAVSPVPHDRRGGRPSPAILAAIGLSAAVHAGLGLYLYTHKFLTPAPVTPPETVITMAPVTLERPPATAKAPPPTAKPDDTHPRHVVVPTDGPQPNGFVPLAPEPSKDPEPTVTETPATPRVEPPLQPKIIQPHWISLPTADELMDAYPARALSLGKTGAVTLSCGVAANGAVRDCAVISETPKDMGFGAAALKLQRYFRMTPKTEDGKPVEGGIVPVAIRFTLAD